MEWTAQTVKELRLRAGWSVAELSRRLAVKSETVRQWEDGAKKPDDQSVIELEKIILHLERYNFETITAPTSECIMSEQDIDQVHLDELDAVIEEESFN